MVLGLPFPLLVLLLLPLLFPASRALAAKKGKGTVWGLLPVILFALALLFVLIFPGGCGSCRTLPREGLLLSLALTAAFLAYLPVLPEEERRSPAPILLPVLLSLGTGVFLQEGAGRIEAGGALLSLALLLSALILGGAYPGAYLRFFPLRLGGAVLTLGALWVVPARIPPVLLLPMLLLGVVFLLPAPFPRRTEKVLSPGFLRADQLLFVCLPPLLAFHVFRGLPEESHSHSVAAVVFGILVGFSGLLYAKIALFVEEMADGLTAAGTGFLLAGLLTFRPEGREGALSLATILPLATALSGLSLSFLAQRFRTRTFQGLAGQGTAVEPLRLAFLFGAFQGMSLPIVGGFLGEWSLLQALSEDFFSLSLLSAGGIFLAFVLVLGRTRTLFSGEPVRRLSPSDQVLASEIRPAEGWALGLASVSLLGADILVTFGLLGGR